VHLAGPGLIEVRIANEMHTSRPWRIHAIVEDFTLEDVWALPVHGTAADFDRALQLMTTSDPEQGLSGAAGLLWKLRDRLGSLFGLGTVSDAVAGDPDGPGARAIPGTDATSLVSRLPADLVGTAAGVDFSSLPFSPLYRTDDEFAAELSNATVHAVMHLSWIPEGDDRYAGRMAVYVRPRGLFGRVYMAFIKPFRYAIVYPAMMRLIERRWAARADQ
jgi:hypothetical protein